MDGRTFDVRGLVLSLAQNVPTRAARDARRRLGARPREGAESIPGLCPGCGRLLTWC